MTRRKIICWYDDNQFEVEIEQVQAARVRVTLGKKTQVQHQVGQKIIVKCPKCEKENEVRL
jgi:hypothetical protein